MLLEAETSSLTVSVRVEFLSEHLNDNFWCFNIRLYLLQMSLPFLAFGTCYTMAQFFAIMYCSTYKSVRHDIFTKQGKEKAF